MTGTILTSPERGIIYLEDTVLESGKPFLASIEGRDSDREGFIQNLETKLKWLGYKGKVTDLQQAPTATDKVQNSYWIITGTVLLREKVDEYFKQHFGRVPDRYVSFHEPGTVAIQYN